jgi:hypothetical protein
MNNKESVTILTDLILEGLKICNSFKETWKTDKPKMMRLMEANNKYLYDNYPRICTTLVQGQDITPLLLMLKQFSRVQSGEISLDTANDEITTTLNEKYVNGVLYSDKLVKERESKMHKE